jgi:hypothetical protein
MRNGVAQGGTEAGWASETEEQASGEGHVILKIADGFLINWAGRNRSHESQAESQWGF